MPIWTRFKSLYYQNADLGLALDISRIPFPEDFLASKDAAMQSAFAAMRAGAKLPAHGVDSVCQWCEMSGLCRKDYV
jgi:hypothetical protein